MSLGRAVIVRALPPSRLPHVLAWVLACVTFPLVWLGGLVTTYGAGMAVPDWPNTFGYNLFLYPLESWLGVWDVFLEHSHRLLAAAAGLVTIALAVALWRRDPRRWVRWLGEAALAGVCFQGLLGGLRVTENAVLLAKVHGCTAPLFFALSTSLVAFTSPAWRQDRGAAIRPAVPALQRLALATAAGLYLQIVLGAQLRHHNPALAPAWFTFWLWLHVLAAGGLAFGVLGLVRLTGRRFPDAPILRRRGRWLLGLFLVQLVLGAAAWVTHYNWPAWLTGWTGEIEYTVVTGGLLQAVLTTAHVAVGSLALAVALSLTWWSLRVSHVSPAASSP